MKVVVLDIADADLMIGYYFYESQQHGLGAEFRESILTDIAELGFTGGIHSKKYGHFRSMGSRFPFDIFYELEGGTVLVNAILDARMNPETIRRRLNPGV